MLDWAAPRFSGGGHWLVRMEWRPSGWSVCLPLSIFPCTIKSRSSLLAPAHPAGPGKRAVKRLWWWFLAQCETMQLVWETCSNISFFWLQFLNCVSLALGIYSQYVVNVVLLLQRCASSLSQAIAARRASILDYVAYGLLCVFILRSASLSCSVLTVVCFCQSFVHDVGRLSSVAVHVLCLE